MARPEEYLERMERVQEKLLQFVVAAREEWGNEPVAFSLSVNRPVDRRPSVELTLQINLDG